MQKIVKRILANRKIFRILSAVFLVSLQLTFNLVCLQLYGDVLPNSQNSSLRFTLTGTNCNHVEAVQHYLFLTVS